MDCRQLVYVHDVATRLNWVVLRLNFFYRIASSIKTVIVKSTSNTFSFQHKLAWNRNVTTLPDPRHQFELEDFRISVTQNSPTGSADATWTHSFPCVTRYAIRLKRSDVKDADYALRVTRSGTVILRWKHSMCDVTNCGPSIWVTFWGAIFERYYGEETFFGPHISLLYKRLSLEPHIWMSFTQLPMSRTPFLFDSILQSWQVKSSNLHMFKVFSFFLLC